MRRAIQPPRFSNALYTNRAPPAAVAPPHLDEDVARLAIRNAPQANPKILWNIDNAHKDDIHGVRQFANSFVLVFKDGYVSIASHRGGVVKLLYTRDGTDYKKWVKAIGSNSEVVVSSRCKRALDHHPDSCQTKHQTSKRSRS